VFGDRTLRDLEGASGEIQAWVATLRSRIAESAENESPPAFADSTIESRAVDAGGMTIAFERLLPVSVRPTRSKDYRATHARALIGHISSREGYDSRPKRVSSSCERVRHITCRPATIVVEEDAELVEFSPEARKATVEHERASSPRTKARSQGSSRISRKPLMTFSVIRETLFS
jgi:hypothetical protein